MDDSFLIKDHELSRLLALELGEGVEAKIRQVLLAPVRDLLDRPKKNFRATLTKMAHAFAGGPEESSRLSLGLQVVEALHAGSLIIDDIEDGSAFRRGEPSLHERYGIPIALNAGNWLYFWPLELVRGMQLRPETEREVYRLYHRTLLRAHFGQALDVGVKIDEVPAERIYSTCLSTIELKSGTLTSFACGLGVLLVDGDHSALDPLLRFGHRFGVALQMLDDLGNLLGNRDPLKRWEDLRLRRPVWIWALLASDDDASLLGSFKAGVNALPDERVLEKWMADHRDWANSTRLRAVKFLDSAVEELRRDLPGTPVGWEILETMRKKLIHAYE